MREIFGDPMLAAAILDRYRLCQKHKAGLIKANDVQSQSHRMRTRSLSPSGQFS